MISSGTNNWGSLILHGVNPTGKDIGRGAYGRVFEVDYEGTLCAAKEVHALLLQYAQGDDLQKIKDDFLSECQIWSTLRHPCVVQFLGVYYPEMDQYRLPILVMEKMQHSLRSLVERYENIPLSVKLSILDEVCLGLRYLHNRNPPIVHRDLTPNNILLGCHLEAKITDLGVAKVVRSDNQKTMTKLPGTPDFMPPEALIKRPVYGPSLDVFSYGGVILNVVTQLWPEPTDLLEFNPDTGKRELLSEVTRRQQYLDKMTGDAADLKPLVISCLDDNPKNRPTMIQVSMTIKRVKDVCSQKSSRDGMSPIVWWAEVSNEQQVQMTTVLEQLSKENEVLKADVTLLRTDNDVMKDENKQLTTLLDKMAVNNESQIQQINFLSSENTTLKDKIRQINTENQLLRQLHLMESTAPTDLFRGPVNIKWEEGAPAPVVCVGHTAVWLNGLVYVGGGWETGGMAIIGSYTINCYDPVKNSWRFYANTLYCYFAMTILNRKLLLAGGWDRSYNRTNQILTMDDDQLLIRYSNYAKMMTARSQATAAGHQGMLIITGGVDDEGDKLSSTELFDSTRGQWYMCDNLPQPFSLLRSVIIDNILYVLGGVGKDGNHSPAVFTAQLNSLSRHQLRWKAHQDTPWCVSAPISVHGTQLLIIGGSKKVEDKYVRTSEIYKLNKVSQNWDSIGHIPSARNASAAVSTDYNRIIVIGGKNDKGDRTNTVWIGSCEPLQ